MVEGPRRIDAMIVGAQKAGTSSLHRYLGQHPSVVTHDQLEMTYFVRDREHRLPYNEVYGRYFPADPGDDRVLLAKSVGVMFLPRALERLRRHNPACRALVSLRNPVDRAYSAYWYQRRKGWETARTFEEALALEDERVEAGGKEGVHCTYLRRGRYAEQLERLTERLGGDRWRAVLLEDLRERPIATNRRLFEFLGLDTEFEPTTDRRHNPAAAPRSKLLARLAIAENPVKRALRLFLPYPVKRLLRRAVEAVNETEFRPPPMDPGTRELLTEHFRPHNRRLEEILGRDLSAWERVDPSGEAAGRSGGSDGGAA